MVELPRFEGKLQPKEFVDWLQTVEELFEFKEIHENPKVKIVTIILKSMLPQGGEPKEVWEKMRCTHTCKFLLEH